MAVVMALVGVSPCFAQSYAVSVGITNPIMWTGPNSGVQDGSIQFGYSGPTGSSCTFTVSCYGQYLPQDDFDVYLEQQGMPAGEVSGDFLWQEAPSTTTKDIFQFRNTLVVTSDPLYGRVTMTIHPHKRNSGAGTITWTVDEGGTTHSHLMTMASSSANPAPQMGQPTMYITSGVNGAAVNVPENDPNQRAGGISISRSRAGQKKSISASIALSGAAQADVDYGMAVDNLPAVGSYPPTFTSVSFAPKTLWHTLLILPIPDFINESEEDVVVTASSNSDALAFPDPEQPPYYFNHGSVSIWNGPPPPPPPPSVPPVLSNIEPTALSFLAGQSPTLITSSLLVNDVDSTTLAGAQITIGNYLSNQDLLTFTDGGGIHGVWNGVTGVLTLSGSADVSVYQNALHQVKYANSLGNPSAGVRAVTFQASDGSSLSSGMTRNINVISTQPSSPFTLVIDTAAAGGSSGDTQFMLPLNTNQSYNFTVNWGDGTSDVITRWWDAPELTHTYATSGTKTVRITENVAGGFPAIKFERGGDCLKVKEIAHWGDVTWATMDMAFGGCANLTITATDEATARFGAVHDFSSAWTGCSGLTSFPVLNTAAGTDFKSAWYGCSGLTSFPVLNTAAGWDFRGAWAGCSGLTSFPALNTTAGTDFNSAWYGCSGLTSFPVLNTASGTNFSWAWYGCSGLTSFPLLNTASGTNFSWAWYGCSGLTSFPLLNTTAGTNFESAWGLCSSLTSFPILNTAAGTDFGMAWFDCSGLTSFPMLNTAAGTYFAVAWYGCSGLTSFPALNTAAGTDFSSGWYGCSGLTSFPVLNTMSGTNFYRAWSGCSGLTSFPVLNTAAGWYFREAWYGCSGLTSFPTLDLSNMVDGGDCFTGVTLSTASYSSLLENLAAHTKQSNVPFSGGNSRYDASAVTARDTLTNTFSWTITDGGLDVTPIAMITVAATDAAAGEISGNTGTFTLTRTGPTTAALTVGYSVGGTATSGSDYMALSGSAVFAAGSSTAVITVSPIDDTVYEGATPETVVVTLMADAAYAVGSPSSATVSITDNDLPTITIAATDAAAAEPANTGTFTLTRSGFLGETRTVTCAISGTATNGTDYTTIPTTVTFANGSATATVTVTPINDAIAEPTETVILTIAPAAGYTVGSPSTATVNIVDDEPIITIAATDAAAGEASGNTGTFTLTRTGPTTAALTISYSVGGTATNGSDYTALSGSVVFAAGASTAVITVSPIDDTVYEGPTPETVVVTITANTAYTRGSPSTATVAITDNDLPTITIAATDAAAAEPADTGTFTLTRNGFLGETRTVTCAISGTATNGTDYTTIPTSVTFASGSATATVTVTPINDAIAEPTETVILTIAPAAGYTVGSPSTATVNLVDDEPIITVAATDAAAGEAAGDTGAFTFTRTGPTTAALTVAYAVGGTATSGSDYTALSGSAIFAAGASTAVITVSPIDDTVYEGPTPETVVVTITANTAYTRGSPSTATVAITDNDLPTITIAATDAAAAEPADTGTFTLTRSGFLGETRTVTCTISGTATNGTDYTTIPTTVTFASGSATATVTVTPIDDAIAEPTETVILTIAPAAGYTVGSPSTATVNIVDDEPIITVAATDAAAGETPGDTGTVTLTRTGPTTAALTVGYTVGGTATSGSDYTALSGSAVFAAGSSTAVITVSPIDDTVYEGATPETVVVTITATTAYTVGSPSSATVSITDNELPPVSVVATDASAAEPADTGTFTITRAGPTTTALTVTFTVGGTATSGTDYTALGTTVTIPAGSASVVKTVTPIDDALSESTETVILTVVAGSGYAVGSPSTATVNLQDNDPTVSIVATDATAAEPTTDTGLFTISRTGITTAALTVSLTVGGTATAGTDYTALPASVIIPAGAASTTLTVAPLDDTVYENSETVIVTLAANAAYAISGPAGSATVTIQDNDKPTLSIVATDAAAGEAANPGVFTFTRSGYNGAALTATYAISGTATNGTDYTTLSGSVTFAAGSATAAVTVSPIEDAVYEGAAGETVIATIAANAAYVVGSPAAATVTIAENDLPTITIAATDAAAAEPADTGTFTLTRSGFLGETRTVTCAISGTATNGTDYTTIPTSVTFASGSATATVTVTPINDTIAEPTETVILTISPAAGYTVGSPSTATVNLVDDEPMITVAATDAAAGEASANTGTFTLTRSGPTTATLSVTYKLSGTATVGTDYANPGTTVVFAVGSATATATITPVDDANYEGPETVILTLVAGSSYGIGSPASATVTIADNDLPTVTITAPDATASEAGSDTGSFRISRSGITSLGALSVNLTYAGTATNGVDCTTLPTTVVIPVNQAFLDLTVSATPDQLIELSETIVATVQASAGVYLVGTPASATVTIDAASDIISTEAGNAIYGMGVNGAALASPMGTPTAVAMDANGNYYITDPDFHAVYKVTATGTLSRFAGAADGAPGFSGDGGPATAARLNAPAGISVDAAGNVFIADSANNRIRKVATTGVITTIAGTGAPRLGGDGGQAVSAMLRAPKGVCVAGSSIYISDSGNSRVRMIASTGIITTIAGGGTGGDGGAATAASLSDPSCTAVDASGNLYIAEIGANRIRKVSAGVISTIAGTGMAGFSGDGGLATLAMLNQPYAVAVDAAGALFISDSGNDRVRRVAGGGIGTVAGGAEGYAGDGGPAGAASMFLPMGITFAPDGSLHIVDSYNSVIRRIAPIAPIPTGIGAIPRHADGMIMALLSGISIPAL